MYRASGASVRRVGTLQITRVVADTDSAKVSFRPVAGARDYRIYAVERPSYVKYAGLDYRAGASPPELQIEFNGLPPRKAVSLVVEAVDALGPAPIYNLPSGSNDPRVAAPHGAMRMLGANGGPTLDGNVSVNGQGDAHDRPHVISRSRPFSVEATGKPCLPSRQGASQVLFDTFPSGTIVPTDTPDIVQGRHRFRMKADAVWDLIFQDADVRDSYPFIMDRHFMDVLFDGSTPGSNGPLHVSHALMSMTPERTFDFSSGRWLHLTMEVDAHVDSRRWVGFGVAPAADPLQNWYSESSYLNRSNQAVLCHVYSDSITFEVWHGFVSRTNRSPRKDTLSGPMGQAKYFDARPTWHGQRDHGLDNRVRFDLYLKSNRYVIYEDGDKVSDHPIPAGIPFGRARAYFTHYVYHTANEVEDLKRSRPFERFWLSIFPYSDERHWDNMGCEVLPADSRIGD